MVRVKRGVISHRKRERLLKHAKGFKWGRKSKERYAREALLHAWTHSYVGRKHKKRDARRLWQVKIGAAARTNGISYNKLINALSKKNIELDRKILAELAEHHPKIFSTIVESAK
jgi:large subunit ribosomal protein L20